MERGVADSKDRNRAVWALLAAAVLAGLWLRFEYFGQSLVGDEMSTLWIVEGNDLAGVVDFVRGDGEISPPLYFVLAWFATKLGSAPELVRLPSLLAGFAALPLYYLLGRRLFGPTAAVVATATAALSPILIYFSGNGRAYSVTLLFLLVSTFAMLKAAEGGQKRWWFIYALASCLAMYTHYTAAFVLAVQLGWLLVTDPRRRLAALAANAGAALFFLPWIPSFLADSDSPTTPILEALQGSGFDAKRTAVEQLLFWKIEAQDWSMGGRWDALLIVAGVVVALAALAFTASRAHGLGSWLRRIDRNLVLVILIAVATPVGALLLATFSTDIFGGRNLAASWVGIPLLLGALMAAAPRAPAIAGTVLVLAGLGAGAVQLADPTETEFRYKDAAAFVKETASPGHALIDTSHITPVPLTPLDAHLDFPGTEFRVNQPEVDPPFLPGTPVPDPAVQMKDAFATGDRVYVVTLLGADAIRRDRELTLIGEQYPIPDGWRVSEQREFDGIYPVTVTVIDRVADGDPVPEPDEEDQ